MIQLLLERRRLTTLLVTINSTYELKISHQNHNGAIDLLQQVSQMTGPITEPSLPLGTTLWCVICLPKMPLGHTEIFANK